MNQFDDMTIEQLQKLNDQYIAQNDHPTAEELLKRWGNARNN